MGGRTFRERRAARLEEQRDPKKALEGERVRRRKRGKPHTRWIDNVEDDLRKMGIKRWRLRTAIGENGEEYVRRPESYKNCIAME
jgi:hypothetical protein